jgi:hypothetical protein
LTIFALAGFLFSFFRNRRLFWPAFLFLYAYSAVFYLFFRYEHRFTLPLFPLLVLMAAYGFYEIYKRISIKVLSFVLIAMLTAPLVFSLRLGQLLYQNDSRVNLRNWVLQNLPTRSRILVYARLTRLPSDKEAIQEQEFLDSKSLRKVDLAEANLKGRSGKFFHALNLYDVNNPAFYENLEQYVRDNRYQYLFVGGTDVREAERLEQFQNIADKALLLKAFGAFQETYSPSIGQLAHNPLDLFRLKAFGPPVALYKLD